MTLRFPKLVPLALLPFVAAACGGQIDGSVFDTTDGAPAGDDASVTPPADAAQPADTSPGVPDSIVVNPTDTGPVPPPAGGVGAPCATNADCSSNHCSGGRCTTTCNNTGDCIAGWYCSQSTSGKLCRCTPSGADCGGQDRNCDGVVSSTAPCTTPPPADAGPPPVDSGVSCTSCAQSACGAEAQTCYFDATCKQFLNCIQACSTIPSTCVTQCETKYNDMATQSLVSCMASNCAGCN